MNYPITVIQSSWRARQSQRPRFYYPPLNLPKQVKYLAREFRAGIKAVALYDNDAFAWHGNVRLGFFLTA